MPQEWTTEEHHNFLAGIKYELATINAWAKHHDECLDEVKDTVKENHAENQERLRNLEDAKLRLQTAVYFVGTIWTAAMLIIELWIHYKKG